MNLSMGLKHTLTSYHYHLEFSHRKTRGLVVRMECNDDQSDQSDHASKCTRTEETPPHRKDPTPPSPNGIGGTPTTLVAPNPGTSPDVDQEMGEQPVANTSTPRWGDADDSFPPQATNNGEPHTQAELLESLHKTLEGAVDTLKQLSIHTVFPEHTLDLIQELYRRTTKTKSPEEQGPTDDILSALRKLAKDVEDLKHAAPISPPPTHDPAKPKNVFTTGPTIQPSPKTPKPTQCPVQPNNPWQRHHPARLILQIPPTVDSNDRLTGMKAVEATNAALAQHTKASIIMVKWNDKGNCIAISHPDFTAMDLVPYGNVIAAAITSKHNITCTAIPDKRWHRVILNRVDTGKSDIDEDIELSHFQGRQSDEILKELQANNPSLATISITEARWLTRLEKLHEKSHSSIVLTTLSQEDIDLLIHHVWRVVMYGRLVSFSRYQDTKPIKQCTTCWAYGHLKCSKEPKCRTCASNHSEDDHACLECPSSEDVTTVTPDQPCTTPSDHVHAFTTHSTVCTYVSRLSLFSLYCYRLVSALSGPSSHTIT